MFVYNTSSLKNRRKQLRKEATDTENILWQRLRNKKLGSKFFRQYSLQGYVMDFFCPEKRLAIEIDGKYHESTQIYDKYRENHLKAFDIKFVRFTVEQISNKIDTVTAKINALLLE